MTRVTKPKTKKQIEALTHDDASRKNIPTAEYEAFLHDKDKAPIRVAYERRNRDLDPQLVWRGKDEQDNSDLVVSASPLYIQEKIHPKVLIDDLRRHTEKVESESQKPEQGLTGDLFADFNGLPDDADKTEFYQHDSNWSNRMILGDSLQVMASLAEREGLRGQVQCIYLDPPYGIKFNSNFQWSTTSRDVKDGNLGHITREPEQVKAFRDTWRDGVHSYLTYLRDRLTIARDLLADTGSIFVQIGDGNVHLLRALLDEVFGTDNFISLITFRKKTMQFGASLLEGMSDYILWYGKNKSSTTYNPLYSNQDIQGNPIWTWGVKKSGEEIKLTKDERLDHSKLDPSTKIFRLVSMKPSGYSKNMDYSVDFKGKSYDPPSRGCWSITKIGMSRLIRSDRVKVLPSGKNLHYQLYHEDYPVSTRTNLWADTCGPRDIIYCVQTSNTVIERCVLMSSNPGDLVLDPTCGSGTTAYVAEQWGRRWITIDTSRVSLALARSRIMGARYPYYLLADSQCGIKKEAAVTQKAPPTKPTTDNIRYGFVYERVPHITRKSIANNIEIDVIWEKFQAQLERSRERLNKELGKSWQEWEIPRDEKESWSDKAIKLHKSWWDQRRQRQKEIDASIAAKADFEYLYDKPYENKKKVRVAGPFTVENLLPYRTLQVGADNELIDPTKQKEKFGVENNFVQIILESLETAGVQQVNKEDKINFSSLKPWPGKLVCAEGVFIDKNETKKRAAIFIGPEFGTVSRPDLVSAAREAVDASFDVLVACAFNYDAHSTKFEKLGRIPVLKARMNADLHMADNLKNTGKGNLFVIFGEPDIDIVNVGDDQIQIKIKGVDVFHPNTGEIRSDDADGIACWFIDTDYNEESFFVRHAYFLGANDADKDPYKSLKMTLKAEINQEVWDTLNSDTSRPFDKPKNGRVAVKVINHLGDEVIKIYKV